MKIVCVIPARLKSTRLPRKPLLNICGKSMLQRTFERANRVFSEDEIYIATDSEIIKTHAQDFAQNIVLTSDKCLTGTDRLSEFAKIIDARAYVNLQGDEPIMPIENVRIIKECAEKSPNIIYNGFAKITHHQDFFSTTIPKVVVDKHKKLLYMSRSPIPGNKQAAFVDGHKQICVYSFPKSSLNFYGVGEEKTPNEEIEDIEIMRLKDSGLDIQMIEMSSNTVAVDTAEDLERVRMIIDTLGEGLEEYDCG